MVKGHLRESFKRDLHLLGDVVWCDARGIG